MSPDPTAEPEVRLAPRAQAVAPGRLPAVLLFEEARDDMDDHVSRDTSVESGGVLVGRYQPKQHRVIVSAAIPATRAVGAVSSLTFTHEAWDEVNDIMARDYPDQRVVGWYHSHPHFGIFLSEYDLFIQRNFFSEPWQVAYVVDPLLGQAGFFGWHGQDIERMTSWYVHAHQTARVAQRPASPTPSPTPTSDVRRVNPRLVLGSAVAILVALVVGFVLHQPPARAVSGRLPTFDSGGYEGQRSLSLSADTGTLTVSVRWTTAKVASPGAIIDDCAPRGLTARSGSASTVAGTTGYQCRLGPRTPSMTFTFTGTAQAVLDASARTPSFQAEPGLPNAPSPRTAQLKP